MERAHPSPLASVLPLLVEENGARGGGARTELIIRLSIASVHTPTPSQMRPGLLCRALELATGPTKAWAGHGGEARCSLAGYDSLGEKKNGRLKEVGTI